MTVRKGYKRDTLSLIDEIIKQCKPIDGKDPIIILEDKIKQYCNKFKHKNRFRGYLCVLYELGYIEKDDGEFKLSEDTPLVRKAYEIYTAVRIGRRLNDYPGTWFITSRLLEKGSKLPTSMKNTGRALLDLKRMGKLKLYKNRQYQIENENKEYFLKMFEEYPNVSL